MRILWLKTDLLLPLDKGGKLRTWHLMRHLAKQHEITYLAFAEPDQPRADVTGMREVAARVDTVTRSEPAKGTWRFYADAAMHLVDPLPYAVGKYRSTEFRQRLDGVLAVSDADRETFDRIYPGAIRRPAHVVPTGVDTDFFAPPSGPSGVEGSAPNSR